VARERRRTHLPIGLSGIARHLRGRPPDLIRRRSIVTKLSLWGASLLVCAAGPAAANPPALPPNTVVTWNQQALDTVRGVPLGDAAGARLYAMVNAAMYDAVNGIDVARHFKPRRSALVPPTGAPFFGHRYAAAAAAAHAVLVRLHPERQAIYDARLAADLEAIGGGPLVSAGREWGADVGERVVDLRSDDGSTPVESQPGGSGPGQFTASWSNVQFRNLRPFAIADASAYVTAGPPPLDSVSYAGALAEVKVLGNVANADAALTSTFLFWVGGTGTAQPPGEWVKVALSVADERQVTASISDTARLMALLSMAMADVVAPTFTTKFQYHFWRPGTAIRQADTDGNPLTEPDPGWTPRAGGFGTSPEHTSGHSAFAGAATTALRGFFCRDRIAFTLPSDSQPGQSRTYAGFSDAEAEAGRSRIFGGIHFEFSNQGGLEAGRAVAREVLAGALLLRHGPTHDGECPR
jgi:hypothetical protein